VLQDYPVREALPADIPFLVSFQMAMALETEGLSLDPEVLQKGVEAVFADPAKGKYYVTTADDQPVASLLITPEWSDWRNAWVWWIQSVWVDPAYRNKKLYANMYQMLQQKVLHHPEVRGLRLYVDKSNQNAIGVYGRLGMDGSHYALFEWMPMEEQ
jgi:ribosomal protein S18 acetylase RimI-like enzyme